MVSLHNEERSCWAELRSSSAQLIFVYLRGVDDHYLMDARFSQASSSPSAQPATKKSTSPPKWMIFIAPAVMTFLLSLYPVVVKRFANQEGATANGYVFTFYREIGALTVLFVAARVFEGVLPMPNIRMMIIFGTLGFVGMFVNQFGYITAVYILGPDLVSVFIPTVPVWTTVLSFLLCTERIPSLIYVHAWAKYLGILIAVTGAIALTLSNVNSEVENNGSPTTAVSNDKTLGNGEAGGSHTVVVVKMVGYLGMFVDTFSAALYYVLLKKFIINIPNTPWKDYPITILAYCYSFSAVFMAVSMLYYVLTGQLDQFIIPQQSLVALLYAVFITSALCYFLISWISKYLPSSVMSAYQPLQVPTTIIAEYIVFGDQLTINQYMTAVVIIFGVLCVLYSNHVEEQLFSGQSVAKLDQCCSRSDNKSQTKHPYIKLTNFP